MNTPSFVEIREALSASARRQGYALAVVTNADFTSSASLENLPQKGIFWDKDTRLAALLEHRGMRLFNSAKAIALCDDKALSYLALLGTGVPLPRTLLCPISYPGIGYASAAFLPSVADELSLPFVIKEVYGSFGKQVYLARTLKEAAEILERTAPAPLLFQEFIKESAGRDLRVYVVGQRVCGAMLRENTEGDFRANAALGSKTQAYALSAEEERVALDTSRLLGLDFAGVDLLMSSSGPLVCEVNSNAHFRALRAVTGMDPSDAIIALLKEASV